MDFLMEEYNFDTTDFFCSNDCYTEFVSSCDEVDTYLAECEANYQEAATQIVLDGGSNIRQKLQYLNEQADEKESKGIKAIIEKFKQFVDNVITKIKEFFTKNKVKEAAKIVESNPELGKTKIDMPDPKAFEKYIKLRNKAVDNVIKKLHNKRMRVTAEEFDDMVETEFAKVEKIRRTLLSVGAGVLCSDITARLWNITGGILVQKKIVTDVAKTASQENITENDAIRAGNKALLTGIGGGLLGVAVPVGAGISTSTAVNKLLKKQAETVNIQNEYVMKACREINKTALKQRAMSSSRGQYTF